MKYLGMVLLVTLTVLSGCLIKGKKSVAPSAALPEATLVDANGQTVALSSFKGKKVFVNLWATWCPPCVAEMPSIKSLYETTDNSKAAFVMISFDKNFETAKKWMAQRNFPMPVYAISGDVPELFNVEGIPTTFIFNEEGQVIFSQVGQDNYNKPAFVKMLGGASLTP